MVSQVTVARVFNHSTQKAERDYLDLCEFETNLVFRTSSRTGSKTSQRNPVSKKNKTKQSKQQQQQKASLNKQTRCDGVPL